MRNMRNNGFNPYFQPQRTTVYHSDEWNMLVSTGWITATVDANGIALMFRDDSKDKRIFVL